MYHVYALVDPRDGQPFYIGKGKDGRRFAHFKDHSLKGRNRKSSKIKAIRAEGLEAEARILLDGLTESEAFAMEIALIEHYGRLDIGTGILTNMTPGGDGCAAHFQYERTDYHRDLIANTNRTRKRTPEELAKRSAAVSGENNPMYGRKQSDEARAKMSSRHKETGRMKGKKNPTALRVHIFNNEGKLMHECHGNFLATCREHNLPGEELAISYRRGGTPIFTRKRSSKFPHHTGWYARIIS